MIPQIDLRRTYLIARRDFLGYIKTWGFWISFLMPFVMFVAVFGFAQLNINIDPVRYETILDETGEHREGFLAYEKAGQRNIEWNLIEPILKANEKTADEIKAYYELHQSKGMQPLYDAKITGIDPSIFDKLESRSRIIEPPSQDIEDLKSYLLGEKFLAIDGASQPLDALLHIYMEDGKIRSDYWTTNINNERLKNLSNRYFQSLLKEQYLQSGGLSSAGLSQTIGRAPRTKAFNPSKASSGDQDDQAVSDIDRIPYFVAGGGALLLWLTIFSGAYMLLTSMLEEKLNKLLEMMLSTTRLSEIMLGKLLGVAALTITAMLPYIVMAIGGSLLLSMLNAPGIAEALKAAVSLKLVIFFFVFLVIGYVFYGALFIAVGSLAESMQDAQTLTTPIVLVLTACVMVVPLSFRSPDSPLLDFAAWFPLSAPFAAIARIPEDPPWWELTLSAFLLFLMSILVVWLAGRIFRYGVLSGAGVKSVSTWIKRVIFRRKLEG